ncbi:uncharacterized protein LOC123317544 [Coccinella septempunctata]|uniref:uncharacterized protein LOC123317544 n=1 Tax=Coccinella septempunctata TaxID=41139 RepID=UPI001D06800C|nr:uncharacterized protein LOC123317544 [Coccinella septempunctata]
MLWDKVLFFAICVVLLGISTSAPRSKGETGLCFGFPCPEMTVGCKKVRRTSDDRTTLVETVSCVNDKGLSIQNHTKSSPSPYGPQFFQTAEYEGTYRVTKDGRNEYIKIKDLNN